MDPSADLTRALVLLGLDALPSNPAELSRLVAHRHPAAAVWGAEHSWAYRTVWSSFTQSTERAMHPGRR